MAEPETQRTSRARPPWIALAILGGILAVAAVIFSAAGPDRSLTDLKNTIPYAVNPPGGGGTREMKAPNVDMPTAPQSR